MFQKGQRIAVSTSDYFESLGEVLEVHGETEDSLVKVKWGKKTGGKEEWIQAKDLLTKLESKRFNHWKLFGAGWGEKSGDTILNSELSIVSPDFPDFVQTLREARAILKKDFDSWFQSEWERKEHRFSTFFFSCYNLARGRDFLDASAYVDENEMHSRLAEIKSLDQKIAHVEKTGQLPRPDQPQEPLAAYGQMQAFYLAFHPEIARSALWQRINEMIGRGVLTTALPMAATASDLEAILKDIDTYNLEVAEGSKRHLGYGYLDIREVKDEIARLLHIEANHPDAIQLMKQAQAKAYPRVADFRKDPNLRTVYLMKDAALGFYRVDKAILKGAAELIDDPSLALMLVAGAGAAGPLSRKLIARLIAAGVPLKRAQLMGLAFNGMTFHTSKSAMEFGLDQLPGVDRSRYIDFSAAGNLHAIAMMGFLGQTQKLYGASVQGYLRFLKDQPALQKTLDVIGSKTFETIGLTSFNLGLSTAHNGFEALSPDNIYRELIDSARFTIAYGAMHAGQHIKKGPAQEGFELAQKNLWAEVRRQEAKGKLDRAKIRTLTTNAQKAFEAFQSEQNEGLKRNERLGRRSVSLRRVSGGSGLPDVSSIYGRAIVHVIEPKNSLRRDLETLCKSMTEIGPEEFKEIVAKLMLLVKARIESGDQAAGEQAHTLDLLIRRAHGQEVLHPLLAELFQQSILSEADRMIEEKARELRNLDVRGEVRRGGSVVADTGVVKGELITPARVLSKAQVGVLEALVGKGRKWKIDATRLDAAISSDDPIKVLRALAELQPIPEYVDDQHKDGGTFIGVTHRNDPAYLEVVGGLVALARQQIRSGRLGLTEAELEIIAKQAGWEKETQPLPRPPSPRATLPISSRGAGSADPHFAQRVVDSVQSQVLRDTLQGQLLPEDMEPDGRGGQRIANGRLGELLYGAFGTLIMPAMHGGEEGTQGAVVSALVELVEIIESVRRQGIEVDLDPEYWREALNIVGR